MMVPALLLLLTSAALQLLLLIRLLLLASLAVSQMLRSRVGMGRTCSRTSLHIWCRVWLGQQQGLLVHPQ
jgi:hypothetical protein